MSKKIVIFGTGQIAELAHYYFVNDSKFDVAAFTVDSAFKTSDTFADLPLVEFESIEDSYPPSLFDLFVAISYAQVNQVRAKKVSEALQKGYHLVSYVSSRATIFGNVTHGHNCFILENNVIQPFVRIGANCTLWSGNHIGHHSIIEDDCFISSHVVISGGVKVERGSFIGVNSTIREGVIIGAQTLIGAGSLILQSTEPKSVFSGVKSEARKISSDKVKNF